MAQILFVDDSFDFSRAMAAGLRHAGHTVDVVDSGEAALGYLQASIPDLIILDLLMPDLDGAEVLRQLREHPLTAGVPVVVCTAVADLAVREHALARGAQDYWVKASFNFGEINQRLSAMLQR